MKCSLKFLGAVNIRSSIAQSREGQGNRKRCDHNVAVGKFFVGCLKQVECEAVIRTQEERWLRLRGFLSHGLSEGNAQEQRQSRSQRPPDATHS